MEIKKDIEKMAKLNVSKFKQYCETENLEKLHNIKLYADTYANPRNMVAGRIGAKTVRE